MDAVLWICYHITASSIDLLTVTYSQYLKAFIVCPAERDGKMLLWKQLSEFVNDKYGNDYNSLKNICIVHFKTNLSNKMTVIGNQKTTLQV